MDIERISSDSDSELEKEFDDLDLCSTEEEDDDDGFEDDISAPGARKKHAPRQWRFSGFAPMHIKFFDRTSGINAEFEIEGNKASDCFRAFFDSKLMDKIVEETNNYQQQNAVPTTGKTAAWYDTTVEELYIFFDTTILMGLNQKNRIKDY